MARMLQSITPWDASLSPSPACDSLGSLIFPPALHILQLNWFDFLISRERERERDWRKIFLLSSRLFIEAGLFVSVALTPGYYQSTFPFLSSSLYSEPIIHLIVRFFSTNFSFSPSFLVTRSPCTISSLFLRVSLAPSYPLLTANLPHLAVHPGWVATWSRDQGNLSKWSHSHHLRKESSSSSERSE